jgi:hypothetical protein
LHLLRHARFHAADSNHIPSLGRFNREDPLSGIKGLRVAISPMAGKLTRTGDVTELLRQRDDRFVIFGPGDVVTASFEVGDLPDLPLGWVRSFVLRTWGYCKDSGIFTASGDTIEPLPFHKMSVYPYGSIDHFPFDPDRDKYQREFNTR